MDTDLKNRVLKLRAWTRGSAELALDTAAWAYQPMKRDNGSPYIDHPLRVTLILAEELGVVEEESLLLAILHDVLESPSVPGFPDRLADLYPSLVDELTVLTVKIGDSREERDEYYASAIRHASLRVKLVKLADRIDNVRSLESNPSSAKVARYVAETRRHYVPLARDTCSHADILLNAALVEATSRERG